MEEYKKISNNDIVDKYMNEIINKTRIENINDFK